jgi:hypothetical protein
MAHKGNGDGIHGSAEFRTAKFAAPYEVQGPEQRRRASVFHKGTYFLGYAALRSGRRGIFHRR